MAELGVSKLESDSMIVPELAFKQDDLTGDSTRELVARHLAGMRHWSPQGCVHALDVDSLRQPDIGFWSAWLDHTVVACGALRQLDQHRGELKSMRVADDFLGRGFGRAMLNHLTGVAKSRGMTSLWLETGSAPAFAPALRMYESAGFVRCGPFNGYVDNSFSIFMTRSI